MDGYCITYARTTQDVRTPPPPHSPRRPHRAHHAGSITLTAPAPSRSPASRHARHQPRRRQVRQRGSHGFEEGDLLGRFASADSA